MPATYISDEEAKSYVLSLEKAISLLTKEHEEKSIDIEKLRSRYSLLKDEVREKRRVYNLVKTSCGKYFSSCAKHLINKINSWSFSTPINSTQYKIIKALKDALFEIDYSKSMAGE